PRGGGSEKNAVPVHVIEALAVIVPDGGERSGRAKALAVANETLNVEQRHIVVGIDARPVIDSWRNPSLEARVGEWREITIETARFWIVGPRNGNRCILEGLRHFFE